MGDVTAREARPYARLVWDGDEVLLPPELGQPRPDQLLGSSLERLIEVAGRTCYDSFGYGRNTLAFHEHLLEVGHRSVHEHATFTIELKMHSFDDGLAHAFQNRPQCWFRRVNPIKSRVTMNLRAVLEWDYWTDLLCSQDVMLDAVSMGEIGAIVQHAASMLAPCVVKMPEFRADDPAYDIVEPETEDEAWVSLFMAGSRGFSHEQVRHGDFSAISQRSTRYVDESLTPWVEHPLTKEWLQYTAMNLPLAHEHVTRMLSETVMKCRKTYETLVEVLEDWVAKRTPEVGRTNARKQARGAARGYLGNALYTEMIFTASVRQWKRMLSQRASSAADAEIREAYAPHVLAALKDSRYGRMFDGWTIRPSPDGIGHIALGN